MLKLRKLHLDTLNSSRVNVYHIVKKSDKYNLNEGYIGVTGNFNQREQQHFDALKEKEHKNYKLQAYYDDFSESIVMYIYKDFPKSALKHAYLLEEFLRPLPNLGLNIAVGGVKEKDEIFNAKKFTVNSMKSNASDNIFSGIKNLVKTFDKSLATFAENALHKSQIQQENNKAEMDRWSKEQDIKMERKLAAHIKYQKENALTSKELDAIREWRSRIDK